jgi:hypothetical protein
MWPRCERVTSPAPDDVGIKERGYVPDDDMFRTRDEES